eukprot:COSAG04_NODE_1185_length_7876_cov_15.856629_6_plen_110_part_00
MRRATPSTCSFSGTSEVTLPSNSGSEVATVPGCSVCARRTSVAISLALLETPCSISTGLKAAAQGESASAAAASSRGARMPALAVCGEQEGGWGVEPRQQVVFVQLAAL